MKTGDIITDTMKTDYAIFRRNLVRVRAVRSISARELSEKCKLRQLKRIADIEEGRGSPSLDEVLAICKEVGYNIDEMIYKEGQITLNFNP